MCTEILYFYAELTVFSGVKCFSFNVHDEEQEEEEDEDFQFRHTAIHQYSIQNKFVRIFLKMMIIIVCVVVEPRTL